MMEQLIIASRLTSRPDRYLKVPVREEGIVMVPEELTDVMAVLRSTIA